MLILLLNFASKRLKRYQLREAATRGVLQKKLFLKVSQYSRKIPVLESILRNICEQLLLNFLLKCFAVIIITCPKSIKSFSGYYHGSYPEKLMLIMNLFYHCMNVHADEKQTEAQNLHLESVAVLAMKFLHRNLHISFIYRKSFLRVILFFCVFSYCFRYFQIDQLFIPVLEKFFLNTFGTERLRLN